MTTWALAAAFLSGLAWSGLDIARKSLSRDLAPTVAATGLTAGMAVLFGGWWLIVSARLPSAAYVVPALLSITFSSGVQLLILESVRRSELSRTVPLLSFTPVATALFGVVVLDEHLVVAQWIGIVLVFVGTLGLGLSRAGRGARLGFDSGGMLMIAAAILISAAAPFDKLAVTASSPAAHGFFQSVGIGVLLVTYLAIRGDLRRIAQAFVVRPSLLGAATIGVIAVGFQYIAYGGALVGMVETVKRVVGLVASLAAGRFFFGERLNGRKLLAVLLMAIGVTLTLLADPGLR